MDDLKTTKPESAHGFYWQTSDDGACFGPFETDEQARKDMWDDGFGEILFNDIVADEGEDFAGRKEEWLAAYEWVSFMKRQAITTDIFNANIVLEDMEDQNEEAVWGECPPEWPQEHKRELEMMLADALFRWMEKHDAWKQFRALT